MKNIKNANTKVEIKALEDNYKEKIKALEFIKDDLNKEQIYKIFAITDNLIKNNKDCFSSIQKFFPTFDYVDYKDFRDTVKNIIDCLDFYENVFSKQKSKWTQNVTCSTLYNTYLELDCEISLPAYLIIDLFDYNEKILSEMDLLLSNKKNKIEVFDITFKKTL